MRIHETDNVEIRADGMKYALCDIAAGEKVMKYGFPIGAAPADIKAGEKVHTHNLKSRLSGLGGWEYRPEKHEAGAPIEGTFMGYRRADGSVGIRNYLAMIPSVFCANTTVERIAAIAESRQCSMWEAIDTLVGETPKDSVEKAIIKKVTDFVSFIRTVALEREVKSIYDFGLEVATRSGLLTSYRLQNSPEAKSAVDNIEELLNTMQEYNERTEADIRAGEREEFDRPTVEEWLQNVMLMTDMDNEDPDSNNKVTLMTVHSAKGLEYKYVYIVGCEENLCPSMMALESPDGLDEERRLFYVALTRAKTLATLTCADMRFRWGQMNFSNPSRFLTEIDPQYVESDFDLRATRRSRELNNEQEDAVTVMRRRFDIRNQEQRGSNPMSSRQTQPQSRTPEPPKPTYNVDRLKRVVSTPSGAPTSSACSYSVGQRVSHPKFYDGIAAHLFEFDIHVALPERDIASVIVVEPLFVLAAGTVKPPAALDKSIGKLKVGDVKIVATVSVLVEIEMPVGVSEERSLDLVRIRLCPLVGERRVHRSERIGFSPTVRKHEVVHILLRHLHACRRCDIGRLQKHIVRTSVLETRRIGIVAWRQNDIGYLGQKRSVGSGIEKSHAEHAFHEIVNGPYCRLAVASAESSTLLRLKIRIQRRIISGENDTALYGFHDKTFRRQSRNIDSESVGSGASPNINDRRPCGHLLRRIVNRRLLTCLPPDELHELPRGDRNRL